MTNWKNESVVIVGGGIGGLAAGSGAVTPGHVPRRSSSRRRVQGDRRRHLARPQRVLDARSSRPDRADQRASRYFPIISIMRDSITGEEVTRIPLGDAFRKKFHHPYALIHRADLHKVLLDACRKSNRIRLDASQKVVKVDETDGGIAVTTESGKVYRGAALIGADGLWSTIRQMIVGDGKPKPAGHITYRAVLADSGRSGRNTAGRTWLSGPGKSASGALPAAHRRTVQSRRGCFIPTATRKAGQFRPIRPSSTSVSPRPARRYARCCPRSRAGACGCCATGRRSKEWSRGRITLLGDVRATDAAISGARRRHVDQDAVCLADKVVAADGDYGRGVPRLSANALSAHRPRPDHGARLWRVLSRLRCGQGTAQHDAFFAHGRRRHGRMEWLYGEQKELTRAAALA